MDIRIGVTQAPRELDLTVDDNLRDEIHELKKMIRQVVEATK